MDNVNTSFQALLQICDKYRLTETIPTILSDNKTIQTNNFSSQSCIYDGSFNGTFSHITGLPQSGHVWNYAQPSDMFPGCHQGGASIQLESPFSDLATNGPINPGCVTLSDHSNYMGAPMPVFPWMKSQCGKSVSCHETQDKTLQAPRHLTLFHFLCVNNVISC